MKQTSEYQGPLAGLNVIDFGNYYAGPMAAMLLADQGANVIRIVSPSEPDLPATGSKKNIFLNPKNKNHETAF